MAWLIEGAFFPPTAVRFLNGTLFELIVRDETTTNFYKIHSDNMDLKRYFEETARKISDYAGKPFTFATALLLIIIWATTGPIFKYSDTWQLVINTSTTIITFLMVFLVQSAQNRDAKALQLKLDELIFKLSKADNLMIDIEELGEDQLAELSAKYKKIRGSHNPKDLENLQNETRAVKMRNDSDKAKRKTKKPKTDKPKAA